MKKLLITLMLLGCTLSADALQLHIRATKEEIKAVNTVGFKLLNENRIPTKISFYVKEDKVANAWTSTYSNLITVTDTLLKTVDSEDELAAVIAHEISHGVDGRQGILRGAFSDWGYYFSPKKYEYKADKRAIDYLVKAGYNPLAYIVISNKIMPQARFDWYSTHPLTTRRMAEVYEYIYVKYPQYLVQNEYKDNIYYQNFLLTSKENREKLEKKINEKSKRKVNYL